jgi:hypothetical protein
MPHLWKGSMVVHRSPIDMARGRASGPLSELDRTSCADEPAASGVDASAPGLPAGKRPSRTATAIRIRTAEPLDGGGNARKPS